MSEIILSNRVLNMAESATLAMTNKSRELKAQGVDVISLSRPASMPSPATTPTIRLFPALLPCAKPSPTS